VAGADDRPALPEAGAPWPGLAERMQALKAGDLPYRSGRTTRAAFHASEELEAVKREAVGLFLGEDGLFTPAFESLRTFESEVVAMVLSLTGAPADAAGTFTSGGTESILLACLSAREWAREVRRIERPRMLLPASAHPAFDKAAHYLGLEAKRVPLGADFRADVARMAEAVDARTALVVASAPSWPYGTVDDVEALAGLARRHGLWLHVDGCIGAFVLPFLAELGYRAPLAGFFPEGVASVSADLHKYGYAAKGASTVLFRRPEDRGRAVFFFDQWAGGPFYTSGLLGTRSGGALASAWAVLHHLGRVGYRELLRTTLGVRDRIRHAVEAQPALELLGDPEGPILAFRGRRGLEIPALAGALEERGWLVTRLPDPEAIHLILNPVHATTVEAYLTDLRAGVAEALRGAGPRTRGAAGYAGPTD